MELKDLGLVRRWKKLRDKLGKRTLLLAMVALGVLLLLLSTFGGGSGGEKQTQDTAVPVFSLEETEKSMAAALGRIDGVGKVEILLTLRSGPEAELATDALGDARQETVVVSEGSGVQAPVVRRYVYPEYQGALVVAQGGGVAEVRLRLTEAVAALTGLSKDRITVLKMQEGR